MVWPKKKLKYFNKKFSFKITAMILEYVVNFICWCLFATHIKQCSCNCNYQFFLVVQLQQFIVIQSYCSKTTSIATSALSL